jgi:hypothetical protein
VFTIFSAVALVLFYGMVAIWIESFSSPPLPFDPDSSESRTAPPHPIPIFIPSDVDMYFVPLRGNFERWDYAPWEQKWYRMSGGIPMWLPLALLLAAPIARCRRTIARTNTTTTGGYSSSRRAGDASSPVIRGEGTSDCK